MAIVASYTVREGMTDPLELNLVSVDESQAAVANRVSNVNIAGYQSVTFRIRAKNSTSLAKAYATGGSGLTVVDETIGHVRVTPGASDFDADVGAYYGFFRVVDAAGMIIDFPNDGEIEIKVVSTY